MTPARLPCAPRLSRSGPTRFDAYVMVDWSAASGRARRADGATSIWIAEAAWSGDRLAWEPERNPRDRRSCLEALVTRLAEHSTRGETALVGFDFSLGYPAGLADSLGLGRPRWRSLWRAVRTPPCARGPALTNRYAEPDNRNNRFEIAAALNRALQPRARRAAGPFHGRPAAAAAPFLPQARPRFPFRLSTGASLARWRAAERTLLARRLRPLDGWWVLGGGAPTVGGQALVGIPSVLELVERLGPAAVVWPFETGFALPPRRRGRGRVVVAEIWPGLVAERLDPALVRDRAQVRATVAWLAGEDAAGLLARRFGRPAGATAEEVEAAVEEEGWILGA